MKVAIGCDHAGWQFRDELKEHLSSEGYEIADFGVETGVKADYPMIAQKVAKSVASGENELGILICGTGIGMGIAANKVKGIRCAMLSDTYSARLTREHNDANMMTLGARVIGIELAKDIADAFLGTECPHVARHEARVAMIKKIEEQKEL